MFDPLSLAVGATLVGAGYLAGRRQRKQHATGSQPNAVKAFCLCGHGLNDHDRETGHCHGVAGKNNKRYDQACVTLLSYDPVPCTCRRYVGPEHITDVWAPPALPPNEQ